MEAKHTPGPWQVEHFEHSNERDPALHISPEADYSMRVTVRTMTVYPQRRIGTIGGPKWKRLAETCSANARLIAAAPDLLEAAQQMACASYVISGSPELTQLRAAIAKATGSAA